MVGDYPVQQVVFVDRDAAGANAGLAGLRRYEVIVISQTTAVPSGTKIGDIGPRGNCAVGLEIYNKYRGTVE